MNVVKKQYNYKTCSIFATDISDVYNGYKMWIDEINPKQEEITIIVFSINITPAEYGCFVVIKYKVKK